MFNERELLKMKILISLITVCFLVSLGCSVLVLGKEVSPKVKVTSSEYSIDVTVKDIPKGQQTLFVPIKIDSMILDFDKVGLEGLSAQNILAVASNSKDKVGTGIGLIKLDDKGLPETLNLKVILKPVSDGQTTVELLKVAEEPALPSKGTILNGDVKVTVKSNPEVEVTERIENGKKRLVLNENRLTLNIERPSQKEETIFIPIILDKSKNVDLDETFGHAIVGPGIAAKSFSFGSLDEGGVGVEILLSEVAEKDFTIDVDLVPRKVGKAKISTAFPQKSHTEIVSGPRVDISPTSVSVVSNNVVLSE